MTPSSGLPVPYCRTSHLAIKTLTKINDWNLFFSNSFWAHYSDKYGFG
jgi:hypothetical protein